MHSFLTLRELRLYLRAWERHGIHFGVNCSRQRLTLCETMFPAACTEVSAVDLQNPQPGERKIALAAVVADDALVYRFPYGCTDTARRGERNEHFLDAGSLQAPLLRLQQEGPSGVRTVILPVAHIYATEGLTFRSFLDRLDAFLGALANGGRHENCKAGGCRYAVEVHNSEYLQPAYFDCLSARGVTHVLGDAVPLSLLDQIQLPHILTAGHTIVRTAANINPEWKLGMVEVVRRCLTEKKQLSVYLTEGKNCGVEHAYVELMEMLSRDLAKLSPIKNRAA